jgi:hypothetical protein
MVPVKKFLAMLIMAGFLVATTIGCGDTPPATKTPSKTDGKADPAKMKDDKKDDKKKETKD